MYMSTTVTSSLYDKGLISFPPCGEDTCRTVQVRAQPPSLPGHHVVYKEAILTGSPPLPL